MIKYADYLLIISFAPSDKPVDFILIIFL